MRGASPRFWAVRISAMCFCLWALCLTWAGPVSAETLTAVSGNELTRDLFSYTRIKDGPYNVQFKVTVQSDGLTAAPAGGDPAVDHYLNKYPVKAEDRYGSLLDNGPYLLVTGFQKAGQKVNVRVQSTPPDQYKLPTMGYKDVDRRFRVTHLTYGFDRVMMTGETMADPESLIGLTKDIRNGVISWTPTRVDKRGRSFIAAPVIMDLTVSYKVVEESFKTADGSVYGTPRSKVWKKRIARLVMPICGNELEGQILICPGEGVTWQSFTRGDISLAIPSNWLQIPGAPPDQGGWYLGGKNPPDMSLVLAREKSVDEFLKKMKVEKTETSTLAGRKVTIHYGRHVKHQAGARVIIFDQKDKDGKVVVLAALGGKWDQHKSTLEQILQSVRFGPQAALPAFPPPMPQPMADAPATPTTSAAPAQPPAQAPAPAAPAQPQTQAQPQAPAPAPGGALSQQEQEELAAKLFKQMANTPNDQLETFDQLYKEIIAKCPQSRRIEEAYWRLSNLYILGFDPPRRQDAQVLLEEFTQKFPKSGRLADVHHRLVRIYEETKQWCKAADLYTTMEKLGTGYPDNQAASVNLLHGAALEKCGRPDEAKKRYQKVLEIEGNKDSLTARAARENLAKLGGAPAPAAPPATPQAVTPAAPPAPAQGGRLGQINQRLEEIKAATEELKQKYAAAPDDQTKKALLAEFTKLKKEKAALMQEKAALGGQ